MSGFKRSMAPVATINVGVIIVAAALVFAGSMSLDTAKLWMLLGTVGWFMAAPVWLLSQEGEVEGEVDA